MVTCSKVYLGISQYKTSPTDLQSASQYLSNRQTINSNMSRPILLSLCVLLAILTLTSAIPANRRERDDEFDKLFAEMFPSSSTTQAPLEMELLLSQMETEFQNTGFIGDLDKFNNYGQGGFLRSGPVYSGVPFRRWFY